MKIYYTKPDGLIIAVNYDKDDFTWNNTINDSYYIYEVDEVNPDNKTLCIDIVGTFRKTDNSGDNKYKLIDDAGTWKLDVKPDWKEKEEFIV